MNKRLSDEVIKLIEQLCCDESERLGRNGAEEIKRHAFFKQIDFSENLREQPAPYVPEIKFDTDTSNFDPVSPDRLHSIDADDCISMNCFNEFGDKMTNLDHRNNNNNNNGKNKAKSSHPDHAFFEFTFRRFFDAIEPFRLSNNDGHHHAGHSHHHHHHHAHHHHHQTGQVDGQSSNHSSPRNGAAAADCNIDSNASETASDYEEVVIMTNNNNDEENVLIASCLSSPTSAPVEQINPNCAVMKNNTNALDSDSDSITKSTTAASSPIVNDKATGKDCEQNKSSNDEQGNNPVFV